MTRKKKAVPASRYSDDVIAARIEHDRVRLGIEVKELADRLGMSIWLYYKRSGLETPWTVEECGRVAEAFGAPRYYPFDEWATLEQLEKKNGQ